MKTSIEIDDALMARAMKVSGTPTKRETVARSLKLLIQLGQQERIRSARGKLRWRGDLETTRHDG